MVELIDNNTLRVYVANSDAIVDNQIKRLRNSNTSTCSYYVGDVDPNRPKIFDFVNSISSLTLPKEEIINYIKFLKEKIIPNCRNLFVGNMDYIESIQVDDIKDIEKLNLKVTGERNYLSFDDSNNKNGTKEFKKYLFGDIMWFDIIKEENGGIIKMGYDENKIQSVYDNKKSLDLKDLANIIKNKYDAGEQNETKGVSFIWFGYMYADVIKNYSKNEILQRANLPESFAVEISKGMNLRNILNTNDLINSTNFNTNIENENNVDKAEGDNYIYYGIPGSGKSYTIGKIVDTNYKEYVRTVFHPDYTYSDFVGQVIPKAEDGNITYEFKPGALTQAIEKALLCDGKVAFVIEEINRGNAAAIFGDVFQLLDRKPNGESFYPIYNKDIYDYLRKTLPENIIKEKLDEENYIKLPSNLSILATMNTSDQNVFTLDTAFKRRWQMIYIQNDIDNCSYKDNIICDTGISWKEFNEAINNKIARDTKSIINSEDKRLGAWFVSEKELNNKAMFAQKVLMYIWNDVAKMKRNEWFNASTFDEMLKDFDSNGMKVFRDYESLFKNAE